MNTVNQEPGQEEKAATGLQRMQFHQIARNGFGDANNSYPHAIAWFNGYLYVGTTRGVLALIQHKRPEDFCSWEIYPIKSPENLHKELDMRAQIWRYHPPTRAWEKVLASPLVTGRDGTQVCLFQGFRNMAVFQGKSDKAPCLYAHTWSPANGLGHRLLRSEDGVEFKQLEIISPEKGFFKTHRALVVFNGKLLTAPSGKTESEGGTGASIVLENEDPLNNPWQQINEDNFGDPRNLTICEMAVFGNYLYAATTNPEGFQLWKTDGKGNSPYLWKQVLSRGAGRGPLNESVTSMCVFRDALYVGSAIRNGGYDRTYDIGPAPSELIRLYPDDSWELIIGDGRITEEGLKVPLSGLGPGFDNPCNTYFWRMCVHEGWLYLGTFKSATFLPYPSRDKWSEDKKRILDEERERELINKNAGFELWRTRDGINWLPVSKNGFGNYYNYGIRTMLSTAHGLFIGAANPFGPEVAIKRTSGWAYEQNPRAGLEIWQGLADFSEEVNTKEGDYSISGEKYFYENMIVQFYGGTGFRAFGYWDRGITTAKEACQNLMEEILSYIPEKKGRILDLACTNGANTEFLLKYYPSEAVTGVCFGKDEFNKAKNNAPGVKFLQAIIPNLREPDGSFDTIINVESLSSCPLGIQWLEEAIRTLKPGGYLLLAEVLSLSPNSPWRKKNGYRAVPVTTAEEFNDLLCGLGLKEVKIYDATSFSWEPFHKNISSFLWEKQLANEIDEKILKEVESSLYGQYSPICAYVIGMGRKALL